MSKTPLFSIVTLAAFAFGSLQAASANDWLMWRGPNGNGVASKGQTLPTEWSPTKNVLWKVAVPGKGHSSPVVVGDRVILATAVEERQEQAVLCFNRETGKPMWSSIVSRGGFHRKIHKNNTHATPTPACDGDTIYATFPSHGVVHLAALDLDGKVKWQIRAGAYTPKKYSFGFGSSPTLYKSLVIVASEFEEGYIAAFDKKDGKEVWRIKRRNNISWSSPIVANVAGKDQLLITGADKFSSFDPNTGKLLWSTPCIAAATCGTAIWENGLVFGSGGYPKTETVAIKADGSGEVVWRNREKSYEQSMVVQSGYVYATTDRGSVFCWRASDGKEMWKGRLGGSVSASPIIAGGHIYATNERGNQFVIKADPAKFELVAKNQLGSEGFASPTICGNRIYVRTAVTVGGNRQEVLYCIGTK